MADPLRLRVPEDLGGERADKVLAALLRVSRSEARYLIDELVVLIDGKRARPGDRVAPGVVVETPPPRPKAVLEPEPVEFGVVLEERSFVVVDKPAGLVVHPGAGRTRGTLAAGLLHRFPDIEGVGAPGRWGLVHRLDRDTSGVLLVARTQAAHEFLSNELAERRVKRTYVALVDGVFPIPTGTIEAPLGRDPSRPTRRAVVPDGKPAITHYELVENYSSAEVALVRVRLETGRTHQIRVHLAAIGHPVVGDSSYGAGLSRVESPRVFLHAHEIEFAHPESGELVAVRAEIPPDLTGVLQTLGGEPGL